ncbi:MAG TPA: aquaporin [Gemmatimonadaceae bacterium]|nr:aquaporin [Gemmatimonadaceae bacterium]
MAKLLTEFIGTFFLVLSVCLSVSGGSPMAPLAIGGTLMVMVYMGGHISGAHYNPAVSLALVVRGAISVVEMVQYWVAQLLGGIVAAFTASFISGKAVPIHPGSGVSMTSALLVEILYTFALALVVCNVATSKKTEGKGFYGLAIGFTVVCAAFAAGGISGGAFNPAVGTALTVTGGEGFGNIWLYWVGPLIGGAIAGVVFKIQEPA